MESFKHFWTHLIGIRGPWATRVIVTVGTQTSLTNRLHLPQYRRYTGLARFANEMSSQAEQQQEDVTSNVVTTMCYQHGNNIRVRPDQVL